METFSHVCPRCSSNLKLDYVSGNGVCVCGYTQNGSFERTLDLRDTRLLKTYTAISFSILALFFHMMSWGAYSFQIPFLKAGQITGLLGTSGYEKIVEACVQRNKWSCAEGAYFDEYKKTGDVEILGRKAHLEYQVGDLQASVKTYQMYVNKGGKNAGVVLQFAVVLEKTGDLENALKYLNVSVVESGDKLPAAATGEMVKILMSQQKYVEAQELITTFWESADNAKGYFNTEFDELKKLAGPYHGHKVAKLK